MSDISNDVRHSMARYMFTSNPTCGEETVESFVGALKTVVENDGRLMHSLSSCLDDCLTTRACTEGTLFDKMLTYKAGKEQFMSLLKDMVEHKKYNEIFQLLFRCADGAVDMGDTQSYPKAYLLSHSDMRSEFLSEIIGKLPQDLQNTAKETTFLVEGRGGENIYRYSVLE